MHIPDAVHALERDLRAIFGSRLRSLVVYANLVDPDRSATLVVVDGLSSDDLQAAVSRMAAWDDDGLETPLLLATPEFERSLDAFPFEFGAILADHTVVAGSDPFVGLRVDPAHLRHACEVQARSHLLHLREGFLETRGRGDALADLLRQSSLPLAGLLTSVARLNGGPREPEAAAAQIERVVDVPAGSLSRIVALGRRRDLPSDEARRLFPPYLDALQKLTAHIDRWRA
jgi:hypothetical protein